MLEGIKNLLTFINNNWTTITIIIGLSIVLYRKIKDYISKSTEEKISICKKLLSETILKRIAVAEEDYKEWVKAGEIKRSAVIKEIFEDYPILSKVIDQEDLLKWIDSLIDEALKTLREIVSNTLESTVVE